MRRASQACKGHPRRGPQSATGTCPTCNLRLDALAYCLTGLDVQLAPAALRWLQTSLSVSWEGLSGCVWDSFS